MSEIIRKIEEEAKEMIGKDVYAKVSEIDKKVTKEIDEVRSDMEDFQEVVDETAESMEEHKKQCKVQNTQLKQAISSVENTTKQSVEIVTKKISNEIDAVKRLVDQKVSDAEKKITTYDDSPIKRSIEKKAYKKHKHEITDVTWLSETLEEIKEWIDEKIKNIPVWWTSVWGGIKGVRWLVAGSWISIDDSNARYPIISASWWSGSGDVVWPASATDGNIALYNWATGKLIKNSAYSPTSFAPALTSDQKYVTDAQLTIISATTASFTTTDETKLDNITVTQPVDLDQMEADIAALANGMVYKWNRDASAWTFPWAWVAQTWWFYTVSVWGTVDSVVFNVWDRLIALADNASTTVYAWNWTLLDATDAVTSVNWQTWNVTGLVPYTWATADLNMGLFMLLAPTRRATTSAGVLLEASNGTDIWLLWAWNTANITWYGSHNYDTATQDTIAIFTGSGKTLWSAALATYPSLIELSYWKWVTSAIQTQLNTKITASSTDTLTNKTLTAPKFADLWFIADANGNEMLVFDTTASAVNHWSMTNASWTSVILEADGDTANINAVFRGQGNGRVTIGTATSTALVLAANQPIEDNANRELVKFTQAATAVNEITIGNAATGTWPTISSTWDDTNIDLNLTAKWTGVLKSWWVVVPTVSSTNTLTNKRITPRVTSETSSATPTINTDNSDIHRITALAVNITSMTTNLSWTPTHWEKLIIEITGTAARTITWGASFEASTVALPTTTVTTDMLTVWFIRNSATSKWRCVAVA